MGSGPWHHTFAVVADENAEEWWAHCRSQFTLYGCEDPDAPPFIQTTPSTRAYWLATFEGPEPTDEQLEEAFERRFPGP